MQWKEKKERLYNRSSTLHQLISIRDSYLECTGFTRMIVLLVYPIFAHNSLYYH